ncbi:MAG: DUF4956 domain-containing protein [Clostridia bacterium]|nr:DUF4956 domain-containing protein [Clostridia bacterium]
MFDSVYTTGSVTASEFFLMTVFALAAGLVFSWIISFRVKSTKRFFAVTSLIPFVVASVITFVNGNIGAGVAIGGAFALIRFRSAPGTSDEIAAILMAMGSGIAFGMGYLTYGVIILLGLSAVYYLISSLPVFEHKDRSPEMLLRITIPESLEYNDVFEDIFSHYLISYENVGVKTTGMGSMFRLSFKIRMKDKSEEKNMIDELRTRNGNLEIAITPYTDVQNQL